VGCRGEVCINGSGWKVFLEGEGGRWHLLFPSASFVLSFGRCFGGVPFVSILVDPGDGNGLYCVSIRLRS